MRKSFSGVSRPFKWFIHFTKMSCPQRSTIILVLQLSRFFFVDGPSFFAEPNMQ